MRPILTARRWMLAIMLALIVGSISACGLKGDLYLPEAASPSSDPSADDTSSESEETNDGDSDNNHETRS